MSDDETSKSKVPKLQPETDRGGSGRPPRKTAIGYFAEGEDDDSYRKQPNLRFGQKMIVRIMSEMIGGYRVKIRDTSVEAFLKTDKSFQLNIRLAVIFKEFTKSGMPIFVLTNNEQENFVDGKPVLRRFYCENIDSSNLKHKRRSDSIPKTFESRVRQIDFEETNVRRFVRSIGESDFNGCIKFSSQQLLARGFLIILDGRCVGAEFRSASEPFDRSVESSILCILEHFAVEDADVQVIDIQRELVFVLSIPFQGHFDSWHLKDDAEILVQMVIDWFRSVTAKTGLIYFQSEWGAAWAVFFQGDFIGYFDIENQVFTDQFQKFEEFVKRSTLLDMQTYVLPFTGKGSTIDTGFDLAQLFD